MVPSICLMITKVNWVMRVRIPKDQYIFFITILYFLNDKACMSYDHGSLNRRPGGLCVIGELYALLLSYNSLLLGDEILSNLLTSFHFTPFDGCKRSVCGP